MNQELRMNRADRMGSKGSRQLELIAGPNLSLLVLEITAYTQLSLHGCPASYSLWEDRLQSTSVTEALTHSLTHESAVRGSADVLYHWQSTFQRPTSINELAIFVFFPKLKQTEITHKQNTPSWWRKL